MQAASDVWPDPIRWIETNFFLYDTGQLMILHERQRRALVEALSRDSQGRYNYNMVIWSWPKKSGKSSIIAAVALYIMVHQSRAQVKLVANDLKQADSRVGYYLREAIKLHPVYRTRFRITPSGYHIENLENGAQCEMLPIDPAGEAGGNDDLIVLSELWAWKSDAHQKMYAEMSLSPTKFGQSQIWVDTYAGFIGESPVLEQVYDIGKTNGEQIWGPDWEVYANRPARQLTVWVTRHHLPWQVSEEGRLYLEAEKRKLVPAQFERLHHNQWANATQKFLPNEWWTACRAPDGQLPPLDEFREIIVGVDAAIAHDCFGIVAVSRQEDTLAVRYVRKWTADRNGTIDFENPGKPDDTDYPEGEIRRLAREYNVIAFVYDPYQLHSLCSKLSRENVGYFRDFGQNSPRMVADKNLYDMIRDRRIVHDGTPDLTEHISNADAEIAGRNEDKMRIVKRSESLKIDLAISLSMACFVALELLPE